MPRLTLLLCAALLATAPLRAHDIWLLANMPVVRLADAVQVDLQLGNHGNDHRDFKLASKVALPGVTLVAIAPDGSSTDLKPRLVDLGSTAKEGYYSVQLAPTKAGLYLLAATLDQVMTYGPVRSVQCAKTFVQATAKLDQVAAAAPGFDRVLQQPLELVCASNPVGPTAPGVPLVVKLLDHGKPLANTKVSFIPRGEVLKGEKGELDPQYERLTDAEGRAQFTPRGAGILLMVAHRVDETAKGEGYESIHYTATLTISVPMRAYAQP